MVQFSPDKKEVCRNTGDNEVPILRHCSFRRLQLSGEWRGGRKNPYQAMCPGTRTGGIQSYGEGSVPDAIP